MDSVSEYQRLAMRTANTNPLADTTALRLSNAGLGLAGESGEIADMIKKFLYHGHELDMDKLQKEMGDLCWYIAFLADTLDMQLGDILQGNIDKLRKRYPDGFSRERSVNRVDYE